MDYLFAFFFLMVVVGYGAVDLHQPTNGTESYFLSPKGLSKTDEVQKALDKLSPNLHLERTVYTHQGTYTLDNITLVLSFNDFNQKIIIIGDDEVGVSGGIIEISYHFNFSSLREGKSRYGFGFGSVWTGQVSYAKQIGSIDGVITWGLVEGAYRDLTVDKNMNIKRIQPYDQQDLLSLEAMLNNAASQDISPSTIKTQIISQFNTRFPAFLNSSLNHQTFAPKISYNFHSTTHGDLNMTLAHILKDYTVDPVDGYRVIFVSEIQEYHQEVCQGVTVPLEHASFVGEYGGSQNYQLICLYQSVYLFLHSKGWLDTKLDSLWAVSSFQFFAGDLYDFIGNLYEKVSPRQLLEGSCSAQKESLKLIKSKSYNNTLEADATYQCSLSTISQIQVLKFTATVKFFIAVSATTKDLSFKIANTTLNDMKFMRVNEYVVENVDYARFKANEVLKKVVNQPVFGDKFPSITRNLPKTKVFQNYTLFYDSSSIDPSDQQQ